MDKAGQKEFCEEPPDPGDRKHTGVGFCVIIVLLIPRHSTSPADISSACSFRHRQIYSALLPPFVLASYSSNQSIHLSSVCFLLSFQSLSPSCLHNIYVSFHLSIALCISQILKSFNCFLSLSYPVP